MPLKQCRIDYVLLRKELKRKYKRSGTEENFLYRYLVRYFIPRLMLWMRFFVCFVRAVIKLLPVWFEELKKFCPTRNKTKKTSAVPLIVGHRGAAAHAVENTIAACEAGLSEYHANALEVDICITADGQIVLWHDWDPDNFLSVVRQAGLEPKVKYRPFVPMNGSFRKPVNQLSLKELRRYYGYAHKRKYPRKLNAEIPTLNEFFEWAVSKKELRCVFLDCKLPEKDLNILPDFLQEIKTTINRYSPHFKIVLLTAFDKVMERMRQIEPTLNYAIDTLLPYGLVLQPEGYSSVERAAKFGNRWASAGRPTALDASPWTSYRRLIAYDMDRITDNNNENAVQALLAWTINKRRELRCLVKYEVSAIVTDYPERLSGIVGKLQKSKGR